MKPYDAAMRTILGGLAGDLIELFMGLRCKKVVALDTDVSTARTFWAARCGRWRC